MDKIRPLLPPWPLTEVTAAPNAPAFVTLFGCGAAHSEDWAVVTQQDGCGSLGVVLAQPHVV